MRSWFNSLRIRLILLVVLAALPALAAIVYNGAHERSLDQSRAEDQALATATLTASEFETLVNSGHQFLTTLSQLAEVRGGDPGTLNALLANLLSQNPQYANIGAIAPGGTVYASAVTTQSAFDFSGIAWFQTAMATGAFTIGDYMVGPIIAPRYTIHLALPYRYSNGPVKGVVFVALDLGWLDQRVANAGLPAGTALILVDGKGVVLARYPDPAGFVGKSIIGEPLGNAIFSTRTKGTIKTIGLDGTSRLFGFVSLRACE